MPNKNDLFAPPSKEELNSLFAAPSESELKDLSGHPEESSAIEAALSGAAQGATFGFSDELGAAADVAGDVLTGKTPSDLTSKWREYQKQREAVNLKQQEEHPWAYTGGDIAGSILPGLVPGLGIAGEAMTLGKAAKAGAAYGALTGLGTSKADVSKLPELAKDVGTGAVAGGVLGGALHGIVNKIPSTTKDLSEQFTKDSDFLSKLELGYRMGQRGITPTTSRGKNVTAFMGQTHEPNKIANKLLEVDQKIAEPIKGMLAIHEGSIDLDPQATTQLINSIKETPTLKKYFAKNAPELLEQINETGKINPMDAWELKKALFNFSDELSTKATHDLAAGAAAREARDFAKNLNNALKEQVIGYADEANKFQAWRENIIDVLLNPGKKPEARETFLGDLNNKIGGLTDSVENVFGTAHLPGASAASSERAAMYQLQSGLSKLEKEVPEALQHMGFENAEQGAQKFNDLANKLSLLKQFQGHEPHEGMKKTALGQIVGSGEGYVYNMANRLGQLQKATVSAPAKLSKSVYNMTPDRMKIMADSLMQNPSLQRYGAKLGQAIDSNQPYLKNAVLFQILQDPNARDYLKDMLVEK